MGGKPRKRDDGRWEARYVDADGKRKSFYAPSRREVLVKQAKAVASDGDKEQFVPADMTLSEFLTEYASVAHTTMKPRTYENLRDVIRLHLKPDLGNKNLSHLTRGEIQKLYSRKLESLSPARVHCIHRILSTALNNAVAWKYLSQNVCQQVTPPRIVQPDIRPFSKDETVRFLSAAKDEGIYHSLYVLGVTTGARWSELTGLQWRDFDFTNKTMRIERTILRTPGGGYSFQSPKTRGSRRTVRLTQRACEALQAHRELLMEAGIKADGDSLVFTNRTGNPIHNSNFIRRSFKPLLKRARLPNTNWHSATRHTATCLLLLDRVDPKSICLQMGWSSVAFMLENYARFMPGWERENPMDDILG